MFAKLVKFLLACFFLFSLVFIASVVGMFFAYKNLWPASEMAHIFNFVNEKKIAELVNFQRDGGEAKFRKADFSVFDDETGLLPGLEGRVGLVSQEFVLYSHGSAISLIDKQANELHRWEYGNNKGFLQGFYLFSNGNLLINYGGKLVMLDKDSTVLWGSRNNNGHDVIVYDDKIYAVEHPLRKFENTDLPCDGLVLEHASGKYFDDQVAIFSLQGELLREIRLFDSLCKADFHGLLLANGYLFESDLTTLENPILYKIDQSEYANGVDPLHLNSIYIISPEDAAVLDFANEGDILVSLRNINSAVLLDKETGLAKWEMTGRFVRQHEVNIVEQRYIAAFDNIGSYHSTGSSRVLLIDLLHEQENRSFSPAPDYSFPVAITGSYAFADNGNVLVIDGRRIFEVHETEGVVWGYYPVNNEKIARSGVTLSIDSFSCEELDFLKVTCP